MERLGVIVRDANRYTLNGAGLFHNSNGSSSVRILPRIVSPEDLRVSSIWYTEFLLSEGTLTPMRELLVPDHADFGFEDPRAVEIEYEGKLTNIITCNEVDWDRKGCWHSVIGFYETPDFERITKIHATGLPGQNKDCVLFPEKIGGYYFVLHRAPWPWMSWARSKDLTDWEDFGPMMGPTEDPWQSSHIGAGAPPIRTKYGWLELYHGASSHEFCYSMGAVLLDINDPSKILGRTTVRPLMTPEEEYELFGWKGKVIFPTYVYPDGDCLTVGYGAADKYIAHARFTIEEILSLLN